MRNLASIQKIEWKKPIEGKDRIELVGILGWQVITKKDEFQVGDKAVYVEIDSILPEKPVFEFLRKNKFLLNFFYKKRVRKILSYFSHSLLRLQKPYCLNPFLYFPCHRTAHAEIYPQQSKLIT